MASSTSRTFSEVDQRRRRWTDVMTSTRVVGGIGSEDIALSIGLRLCLSELGRLSGQNGVRSRYMMARDADLQPETFTHGQLEQFHRAELLTVETDYHRYLPLGDPRYIDVTSLDVLSNKARALALRSLGTVVHMRERIRAGEAILRDEVLQPILKELFAPGGTLHDELVTLAENVERSKTHKKAAASVAEIARAANKKKSFLLRLTKPPSSRQARRWFAKWVKSGFRATALAGDYSEVGAKPLQITDEVRDLIEQVSVVHEHDGTIIAAYNKLKALISSRNGVVTVQNMDRVARSEDPVPLLEVPSLKIFRRELAKAGGQFAEAIRQKGLVAAIRKFTPLGRGLELNFIGERVEMDTWECNLKVIMSYTELYSQLSKKDQDKLVRIKVWMALAIDCKTRNIVGVAFSLTSRADAALIARAQVGIDKTDIAISVGSGATWRQRTGIKTLITDNGPEFQATAFIAAEAALRESAKGFTPAAHPESKGICERIFKTVAERFRGDPGFTDRRQHGNPDFKPEEHAQLVLDELVKQLIRYILDEYHLKPHAGLSMTPSMAWRDAAKRGCHPTANKHRRRLAFGARVERVIGRHGVTILDIDYQSQELQDHFRKHGSVKVGVHVDRQDIGAVSVQLGHRFVTAKPRRNLRVDGISADVWLKAQRQIRSRVRDELQATESIINASVLASMQLYAQTSYRALIALKGWTDEELEAKERSLGARLEVLSDTPSGRGTIDSSVGFTVEEFPVAEDVAPPPLAATPQSATGAPPVRTPAVSQADTSEPVAAPENRVKHRPSTKSRFE